jgi:predicted ArsR family transcriptional regulator
MIPGWDDEIEKEYLEVLMRERRATPADVAARLGVSESWAVFWLTRLARDGRVRILAVESIEDGEAQMDRQPAARPKRQAPPPVRDLAGAFQKAA